MKWVWVSIMEALSTDISDGCQCTQDVLNLCRKDLRFSSILAAPGGIQAGSFRDGGRRDGCSILWRA